MKNKTLVILAAGMGSRFGGLKQIEAFGPSGEFIIDYSIYDAIRCGFNKVVFVIKEENYDIFRNTIGKRIENHIRVEYVFQKNIGLSNIEIPNQRIKPLGTAHAVYCTKDVVNEPFLVIGSDDFFGYDAFLEASKLIDDYPNDIVIIGYEIKNTLTENGSVKRGIINYKNNLFNNMDESKIEKINNQLIATSLNTNKVSKIKNDTLVSMNMIVFPVNFFDYLDIEFEKFLKTGDLLNDEFLLPNVITSVKDDIKVRVIRTNAKWVGVTYKEDIKMVKDHINELIKDKVYNKDLWSN